MPSALYRPLEQSLKEYHDDHDTGDNNDVNDNNDDNNDVVGSSSYRHDHQLPRNYNHHNDYPDHSTSYVALTPIACNPKLTSGRHNRNNTRIRRCLLLTFVCFIFVYFVWGSLTSMTGVGSGDDADDNDLDGDGSAYGHGTGNSRNNILMVVQRPEMYAKKFLDVERGAIDKNISLMSDEIDKESHMLPSSSSSSSSPAPTSLLLYTIQDKHKKNTHEGLKESLSSKRTRSKVKKNHPKLKVLQIARDSTNHKILNESLNVCNEVYDDTRLYIQNKQRAVYASLPVIYFVTPTYPRREQVPELTRLAHTLLHIPRVHWIVADDHETCNVYLDYLLTRFGIPYTHLASPMPSKYRTKKPAPRGVANRRAALHWLRQRNITNGILYFGDDDNTYDLKLFSEIRETQRVSMFPVGLIADYSVSGPVVKKGKVVGFLDSWVADRRWPVDMAGFAVNLGYMAQYPNANMPYKPGYEEDLFLRSLVLKIEQIEPKGHNCTEILVWHTQTKSKKQPVVRIKSDVLDDRLNLGALFRALDIMGVAKASEVEGINAILSKNGKAKPHSFFLS